jgi:hypothetical protein
MKIAGLTIPTLAQSSDHSPQDHRCIRRWSRREPIHNETVCNIHLLFDVNKKPVEDQKAFALKNAVNSALQEELDVEVKRLQVALKPFLKEESQHTRGFFAHWLKVELTWFVP